MFKQKVTLARLAAVAGIVVMSSSASAEPSPPEWSIAIHGGSGVINRAQIDPATEAAYRASLTRALETGRKILGAGGTSLDAVEAVIRLMEDDPLFNAGRGAVLTAEGVAELDASIMDGATLKAGAVAGVRATKHPISLARTVMERSPHVMLIGPGADAFGKHAGLEPADQAYFVTERRWNELTTTLQERGEPVPAKPAGVTASAQTSSDGLLDERKFGTVGVVARDRQGNLAAGTSTGGTVAKRWGRVGDSPIIGAGTYAANQSCAASGTGTGEYFIRLTIAREVCALTQYAGMTLQQAADEVIQRRLTALGGDGAVIAVGPDGTTAWSFNTEGLYRAAAASDRAPQVAIFKDDR